MSWRTRLFHWSLNDRKVGFAAIMTLVLGFVLSVGIVGLKGKSSETSGAQLQRRLSEKLAAAARPSRTLADSLHGFSYAREDADEDEEEDEEKPASPAPKVKASALDTFLRTGTLMGVNLRKLIEQHGGPQDQQALFTDFIVAGMDARDERGKSAWKRIENAALRLPPAEFANEFLGNLLDDADKPMEAMNAFRREGEFPDANLARVSALRIAVKHKEVKSLRQMLDRADFRASITPWIEFDAGALLGDWGMSLRGLVRMEWAQVKIDAMILALLAALFWYAVFQRFLKDVPYRRLWPLPLFIAGVLSVGITMFLIRRQETLGLVEDGTFPNDLIFYVGGVGLREELSKLALFALFLPWLLKHRSASAAMLAGAFVGLGFAFEENFGYYGREGFHVVIGRLLTANFMHAAMTSLIGYSFYELVRTRFGSAEKFLTTFFGVVLAHGVYDWAPQAGQINPMLAGGGFLSFIILALLAHRFFDDLAVYVVPRRGFVSLVALFIMGVSGLIALSMMMAAWSSGTLAAISAVGADAAGLVPITVLYLRRFHHS